MSLTVEQERAAHAPGSVAVAAGAGTGKTRMLAERYLHHLSHDGLSPLEVVAVTFTEKAAGELRSRIRRRIEESLPDGEEALAELEAAQISTIHALCGRVCREHPWEAGVSPDFGILEEPGGGAWKLERLEEALEELPEEHFRHLPYSQMQEVLQRLLADPLSAERALERGSEGWEGLVEETRERAREEFLGSATLEKHWQTLQAHQGEADDRIEHARANALDALEYLRPAHETGPYLDALCGINLQGGSRKKWGEGELEAVKDALKELRELAREERRRGLVTLELGPADERLAELLPVLREACERVREHISEAKRGAGVLDFADLEAHAFRALGSEEVRSYYAGRWKAFLIDEFQDTSPVQAEIVALLTQGATLTVVGDEQQSIYGFRRAEVEVFRGLRRSIRDAGGSEVVLAESFRAHEGLVEKTNSIFSAALGELHQPLSAHRGEAPQDPPHVQAYAMETEEKVGKERLQRAEATLIARLIGEMLEEGTPVHDPDTDGTRPARPGDFALLSRVWAPLEAYGEALAAAGIPAVHAGGGDLLQTREAKDGLSLLRFLADPADDLALAAVLRSPFFAADDPTLHRMAFEKEGGTSWWNAVCQSEEEALSHARETLEELLEARGRESPAELLKLADRLTGYTAVISNLPGAGRREADWRGFRDLIEGVGGGSGDAFSAVRSLKRLGDSGGEVPRPPVEAGDAVSLTTVHGAKGLEWPMVFLPDLARGFPPSRSPVLFEPEIGVGVDLGDEDGQSALHRILGEKERRDREAEARRLFYVAPTRARDRVVLTSTEWETQRLCGLTLLRPGLEEARVECVPVPFRPEDARPPELPAPLPEEPPSLLLGPV